MSLFTLRHVFVGFVEGGESAIRNAECGICSTFSFVVGGKSFRIYNIFLLLFFLNYTMLAGSLRSLLSLL